MANKERIFYYDLLRAFAIIAVIICHVDGFFGDLNTPLKVIGQLTFHNIGRIGVPIFLMISGALLLNRHYPDLRDFLKRRFSRIVYPFIFWMIIFTLVYIHIQKDADFLWNSFIGNPSIAWYFWTLIGIYLAIPVLNAFIKEYSLKGCEYFLVIWLIFIALNTFGLYPPIPYLKFDFFTGFIGYPILGYWLDNRKFRFTNNQMMIISLSILLVSLGLFDYHTYNYGIDPLTLMYQNVLIVPMGVGMFLFIKHLALTEMFSKIRDNFIGKAITSISICSYGMYFSHVMVLRIVEKFNPHSNKLFPVMFALIIFLSWLLPYILSKIPYVKKVCGV